MRKFNFYPGPSTLPDSVLSAMREEMLEYRNCGASFMELSHRSKDVLACHGRIIAHIRDFFRVGEDYHVLLLPGGAIGQTAAIPMNLLRGAKRAAYAITGYWSRLAAKQARAYCEVVECVDTYPTGCTGIPDPSGWEEPADCAYLHYADNETIHGVEFSEPPEVDGALLVTDQSSNIFSRPFPADKMGLIYACLQKNLGPSGLGLVVVRADLCGRELPITPSIWNYARQAADKSLVNTAPTFQFRMLELMLEWMKDLGGPARMAERNSAKAAKLYECIDGSSLYCNNVDPAVRSQMNVPFTLADENLNEQFLRGAEDASMIGLKGHRAVGGMRASIYNAMPPEGVDTLVAYMREFERAHG